MPRLPFLTKFPKGARIRSEAKPAEYDSSKIYMHMGTALKASETAQIGLLRLAQVISETEEAKELQEAALAERLLNIVQGINEFERHLTKFEKGKSQELAHLMTAALVNSRAAMGWFQKFLESHSDADALTYRPLAERLNQVVSQLTDIRKEKIENAVHMEDAFRGHKVTTGKLANMTHPVVIGPAAISGGEPPTPEVKLSPEELLDNARLEIIQRELSKNSN
jgi:hypothetical protein